MNNLSEKQYRKLKEEIEEARSAAERARGALEQTVQALKKEFGVKNIKEAKDKLAALELQAALAEKEFNKALKNYQKKWKSDEGVVE